MAELVEVRQGAYYDSVSLMQVSRAVQESAGVRIALVAMATELNLGLLAGMGLPCPADAGPNDLLVAVRADDDGSLTASLHALDGALLDLAARGASADGLGAAGPARTVGSAAGRLEATVALVSVPGRHAFPEAVDALDAGLSVVLFSDNVPVEQEVRLKQMAAERDLLVLGPDCGTAVIGGVGLGFANVIRSGRVGLVAASGTGAQQLMCLLDAAGVGIGCCLGVGGRDLSSAVGGRSTRQALAALDADEGTDLIVVVSKPPAPEVSATISAYAAALSTPVQFALLGAGQPDLTTAAEVAIRTVGGPSRSGRRGGGRWRCGPRTKGSRGTGSRGMGRCAGCSAAGPCARRRCSWPRPRSVRSPPISRYSRSGRCPRICGPRAT